MVGLKYHVGTKRYYQEILEFGPDDKQALTGQNQGLGTSQNLPLHSEMSEKEWRDHKPKPKHCLEFLLHEIGGSL